jgi:ribosomal protein S18 acetylase RimI-like enzyme
MDKLEFRALHSSEYKSLISLWQKAKLPFKPMGRDSEENIIRQLRCDTLSFLVAVYENEIVGSVIASHNFRKGWINRLAVHPDFRNKGIAKKLIELAETYFHEHDVFIYACIIEDENDASKNLFIKEGYTEHRDNIYFTKRLKSTI